MSNHMKYNIDLMQTPPEEDTARQYYYIEKAKQNMYRKSLRKLRTSTDLHVLLLLDVR